jgi:hypothetical protein
MVSVNPEQRTSFGALTHGAFEELYPQLARRKGLSESNIQEAIQRKNFFGRLAFLSKYFAQLSATQKEMLMQKVCFEWKYCEKLARWRDGYHWVEGGR